MAAPELDSGYYIERAVLLPLNISVLSLLSVCVSIGGCCCLFSCFALLFVCVCVCVFVVQCFGVLLTLFDLNILLFCAWLNHAPREFVGCCLVSVEGRVFVHERTRASLYEV